MSEGASRDPAEVAAKVVRLISRGAVDEGLRDIYEAISSRQRYLQSKHAFELLEGLTVDDVVSVNPQVRPNYLANRRGVVVEIGAKRRAGLPTVTVDFGRAIGKYRSGRVIFPASCLTVVSKAGV